MNFKNFGRIIIKHKPTSHFYPLTLRWKTISIILQHLSLWKWFVKKRIWDVLQDLSPLQNVKSTYEEVLILVKLCNFTKINTSPWIFFTFLKFYTWYKIAQRKKRKLSKKSHVVHKNRASETPELITVVGARDRSVNQSNVKKTEQMKIWRQHISLVETWFQENIVTWKEQ